MRKPNLFAYSILIIALLALPFVFVYASDNQNNELAEPGILPDSFWYNFEIIKERITLFFTFSNLAKADKLLSLSTERISEINRLIEIGEEPVDTEKSVERYISTLDEMKTKLEDCSKDSDTTKEQIQKTIVTINWQIEILNQIKQKAPAELNGDLIKTIDKANEIKNMKCD